jgi:uncharacterized protein YcfL
MIAMKKTIIAVSSTLLLLAGCGGDKLDLDEEKVKNAVSKQALEQKVIEDENYKESDIEIYKVCKTVENDKKDLGFQDIYRVYWKTSDGKHNDKFILEDYKAKYGNNNYSDMKDSCVEWK